MSRAARALRLASRALPGLLATALLACSADSAGGPTVLAGDARFQFLTASLVRMEYSPTGHFIDAPTAVVQKRDWAPLTVRTRRQDGWLVASSDALTLRYRLNSGPFTAANLEVSWQSGSGRARLWHPGEHDTQNLGGLPYSLDNVSSDNLPPGRSERDTPVNDLIPGIDLVLPEAQPGLLSRAGYALIDDSETPVWNARRSWIEPRQGPKAQDWYLFTYRDDYEHVLQQYAQLCGPVPMIPRYVLGPMVTDLNFEYFPDSAASRLPQFRRYNQQYLQDEVSRLRRGHIPFDTLVLDFAWHNYGWDGGYDWSPLIPQPQEFVRWLHEQGVKLSLNDHPGYINTRESILSFSDSHAPQVLKDLGRAPPAAPTFDLDLSHAWRFAPDPLNRGLDQHWYRALQLPPWRPIQVGLSWQEQGFPGYQGFGWYHAAVQLPSRLPPHLYLYLGEVARSYRIFINGQETLHSQSHWPQRLTFTDLTPYVRAGARNDIVLRVEPDVHSEGGGGLLLGPVAIRDVEPPARIYFDLSNERQAQVSMRDLHEPLLQQGVDFWWVDGGSGAVDMPGLNRQLWTNKVFFDAAQRQSGRRGFILGRYGDWGSERYPGYFTGDTYSQWPVLAYEVAFTARGGNVLVPYISHDIGGFHGAAIDFDLYARWLEFGTFSPLLRMHSAHENPREGNVRMPWFYGEQGMALMRKYFTLRTQLIPYLYSYAWVAHRDSLPLARPLYLAYPQLEAAYQHPYEYFFGDAMLVAPVLDPSGTQTVWLPPGEWLEFFSGRHLSGGRTVTAHYAVDETPVFVRAGALIPEQPVSDYSDAMPLDPLIINVYGSGAGSFDLYEDDGLSLDYEHGEHAITPLRYSTDASGLHRLLIGPAQGRFKGQLQQRGYELRIHAPDAPAAVSVDGAAQPPAAWDAGQSTAVVSVPTRAVGTRVEVTWR